MPRRRMKLNEISLDEDVYPRKQKSSATVKSFVETLKAGETFPPIVVQKISIKKEDGTDEVKTISLDGWHRLEAYKEYNEIEGVKPIKDVEVEFWKDEVLDREKHLVELMVRSAELNVRHGLRPSQGDIKNQLQKIANTPDALNLTWKNIADKLGVTPQWASECVSSILTAKRMSRDAFIYKLKLLGFTYDEIEDTAETSRPTISEAVKKLNEFKNLTISDFYDKHKPIEELAEYYHLDVPLAWAIILDGKDDRERFDALGWNIRTWDTWNFNKCDKRFGSDWPGRIPGQLVAHALYFFTRQNDLVLDPMAGGSVVPDICLVLKRRCYAFDCAENTRPEVRYWYWDPKNIKWPNLKKNPDFVFFDPPYFTKKKKEYKKIAGGKTSISSLSRKEYLGFLENFFRLARKNTAPGARLAMLNADWRDFGSTPATDEDAAKSITIFNYRDLLVKSGWKVTHRIECPLSTERFVGKVVAHMQKNRTLGTIERTLIVVKK